MPYSDDSVHNEPHMGGKAAGPDPSEGRAARALQREADRAGASRPVAQSVFDEPDILPGRPPDLIDQDWSCGNCGYNLRGLSTGHPCPECGHRELYRPPPGGAGGYYTWLSERITRTSDLTAWSLAIVAALVGGPLGVLAAFLGLDAGSSAANSAIIVTVVFVPTIEEVAKLLVPMCIVETRPYLFRKPLQIQVATVGAALAFAVIENVIYLTIYAPSAGPLLLLWRWIACTALHVGCTWLATRGLIAVWRRTIDERRPPRLGLALGWLTIAIVIHAAFNAGTLAFELL